MDDENNRCFLFSLVWVFGIGIAVVAIFCGGEMMKCPCAKVFLSIGIIAVILSLLYVLLCVIPNYNKPKVCPKMIYDNTFIYNNSKNYERNDEDSEIEKIVFIHTGTQLETGAFWGYSKLKSVELPEKLTEIPDFAFVGCTALEELTIPESVTKIGKFAFYGCTNLQKINGLDKTKVSEIQQNQFENCESLKEIRLPQTVKRIEKKAFNGCKELSEITIPDGVTSIGKYAFRNCSDLKSVTIPNSMTFDGRKSTWYYTSNSNYTDGTEIGAMSSDAAANATLLKDTYSDYYLYRK